MLDFELQQIVIQVIDDLNFQCWEEMGSDNNSYLTPFIFSSNGYSFDVEFLGHQIWTSEDSLYFDSDTPEVLQRDLMPTEIRERLITVLVEKARKVLDSISKIKLSGLALKPEN